MSMILRALMAACAAPLVACQSTGGMDPVKPKGVDTTPAWTTYLRGTPTYYDFDALVRAIGPKAKVKGKVIDLQGGRIDGSKLKKPKSRDDEDAVALRLRIPGITLRNGIIDRIPGGIVVGADHCTFERLTFMRIGEDALSNNSDKARGMIVRECIFLNDAGGDKSLQFNDGRDCLTERCYFTGGITGVRVQESTAKAKGVVKFTGRNNTFRNVRTAWNIDGPKGGRTEARLTGNKYVDVLKKHVVRERAKVIGE